MANGYGRFKFYRIISAHRFSYYIFNGDLCEDMEVCHTCDNPKCVNPAHLWQGTREANMRDCAVKGHTNTNKLLPADVRAIRQLRKSGVSVAEIAQEYHVGLSCVKSIISRKTWGHLADDV